MTFDDIKRKILKLNYLGEERLIDGTVLIGKAPDIAPKAWLHKMFPPLNEDEINSLEELLDTSIPAQYREFLMNFSNGLKLYIDTFSLEGYRKRQDRSIESVWQPYSIVTSNKLERLQDSKDSFFYIGSYSWDGSLLYIDKENNKVYRCSNKSSIPVNSWNTLIEMLSSEIDRLDNLYSIKKNNIIKIENTPLSSTHRV